MTLTVRRPEAGAYRFADGTTIDIAPNKNGLRWRRIDGTTGRIQVDSAVSTLGWTDRPDGHQLTFPDHDTLVLDGVTAQRIRLQVTDTTFIGALATRLTGRLVLPPGDDPVPVLVLVHGSEFDSARESDFMQRLLPADGVGTFVYDKRGTGDSEGSYTQDFELLADDVAAAVNEARGLGGNRVARVVLRGASQGGWVAPLAAQRVPVDLVLVVFGLAVSVLAEDREAALAQLTTAGYGPDAINAANDIIDATARVVLTGLGDGSSKAIAELDAIRRHHENAPWYPTLRGNVFEVLKPLFGNDLRDFWESDQWQRPIEWNTPWTYDPLPTLRALDVPQVWVLGTDDLDAPPAETVRRLSGLQEAGRDVTIAQFAGAEHGLTLYETRDGARVSTGYPAGYFQLLVDAATGRLSDSYQGAELRLPTH